MSDRSINVRQVAQYPRVTAAGPGIALLQMGELGSPYASILAGDLVGSALAGGGTFNLSGSITFANDHGPVTLSAANGELVVSPALKTQEIDATTINARSITASGAPVATTADLERFRAASVTSFNQRTGDILLEQADILRAGGAPQANPTFSGLVIAPSPWDVRINDDTVVTANWVHRLLCKGAVTSFNGRTGPVTLTTADVNAAYAVPGTYPLAPSPVLGDSSDRIATTAFVDESLDGFATTYSPQFTGIPTAPTQPVGDNSNALATTAFVTSAVLSTPLPYLPLTGGTLTGSVNMTAGAYQYAGKNLAYIVPSASGDNIFIGESGNTTVTGFANTGNGMTALSAITSGQGNAAFGFSALKAATTASNNTAVGNAALAGTVTGSSNVAVGTLALNKATSANNVAVGMSSLSAETTGANNSAFGYAAIGTQNGATNNVGIGYTAGFDITTGSNNTVVGYNTGRGITTGGSNTIVGANLAGLPSTLAGALVLGASSTKMSIVVSTNTFHGGSAGNLTLTGTADACMGWQSGTALTSGSNNTAIGSQSLAAETTGGGNVAVGRTASSTQNGASNNVAIGNNAGNTITTGSSNIFIGLNTGNTITTGSSNILINYSAGLLAAGTANCFGWGMGGSIRQDWNLTTANTHTFTGGPVVAAQVVTAPVNVSALPAASAALTGARAFVNDATATTFLSIVAGSGANKVPVVCNGTNWLIG